MLSFFPFRFPPFYRWRGFRFVGVVDSHSRFMFSPLFYSSRKAGGWRIFSSAKRNLIDLERHREVESIPIYGKETRIQRARRHDNQVIAKQWRAKGTARSTTQPSTVQANRWAVPPVYGQWRITRVFYSGQQVWTIQASDVACRFGNRSHASFFPMLKISNIFISHIFLSF